jgi:hypothetical protein
MSKKFKILRFDDNNVFIIKDLNLIINENYNYYLISDDLFPRYIKYKEIKELEDDEYIWIIAVIKNMSIIFLKDKNVLYFSNIYYSIIISNENIDNKNKLDPFMKLINNELILSVEENKNLKYKDNNEQIMVNGMKISSNKFIRKLYKQDRIYIPIFYYDHISRNIKKMKKVNYYDGWKAFGVDRIFSLEDDEFIDYEFENISIDYILNTSRKLIVQDDNHIVYGYKYNEYYWTEWKKRKVSEADGGEPFLFKKVDNFTTNVLNSPFIKLNSKIIHLEIFENILISILYQSIKNKIEKLDKIYVLYPATRYPILGYDKKLLTGYDNYINRIETIKYDTNPILFYRNENDKIEEFKWKYINNPLNYNQIINLFNNKEYTINDLSFYIDLNRNLKNLNDNNYLTYYEKESEYNIYNNIIYINIDQNENIISKINLKNINFENDYEYFYCDTYFSKRIFSFNEIPKSQTESDYRFILATKNIDFIFVSKTLSFDIETPRKILKINYENFDWEVTKKSFSSKTMFNSIKSKFKLKKQYIRGILIRDTYNYIFNYQILDGFYRIEKPIDISIGELLKIIKKDFFYIMFKQKIYSYNIHSKYRLKDLIQIGRATSIGNSELFYMIRSNNDLSGIITKSLNEDQIINELINNFGIWINDLDIKINEKNKIITINGKKDCDIYHNSYEEIEKSNLFRFCDFLESKKLRISESIYNSFGENLSYFAYYYTDSDKIPINVIYTKKLDIEDTKIIYYDEFEISSKSKIIYYFKDNWKYIKFLNQDYSIISNYQNKYNIETNLENINDKIQFQSDESIVPYYILSNK